MGEDTRGENSIEPFLGILRGQEEGRVKPEGLTWRKDRGGEKRRMLGPSVFVTTSELHLRASVGLFWSGISNAQMRLRTSAKEKRNGGGEEETEAPNKLG